MMPQILSIIFLLSFLYRTFHLASHLSVPLDLPILSFLILCCTSNILQRANAYHRILDRSELSEHVYNEVLIIDLCAGKSIMKPLTMNTIRSRHTKLMTVTRTSLSHFVPHGILHNTIYHFFGSVLDVNNLRAGKSIIIPLIK